MRYADFYECDICNGNEVGLSLFVQGCHFHCKDCFNPETWDFSGGKLWTEKTEEEFFRLINREYIHRISFLGGSPLCDENIAEVSRIIQKIKYLYPDKKIWVYTGYKWEYINSDQQLNKESSFRKQVLSFIDVLVDGQYECDKRDLSLAFRGSLNQRIIDVKETIKKGDIVLWNT